MSSLVYQHTAHDDNQSWYNLAGSCIGTKTLMHAPTESERSGNRPFRSHQAVYMTDWSMFLEGSTEFVRWDSFVTTTSHGFTRTIQDARNCSSLPGTPDPSKFADCPNRWKENPIAHILSTNLSHLDRRKIDRDHCSLTAVQNVTLLTLTASWCLLTPQPWRARSLRSMNRSIQRK